MTHAEYRFADAYQAIGYLVVLASHLEFMCSRIAVNVGVNSMKVHKVQTSEVMDQIRASSSGSEVAARVSELLVKHRAAQLLRHRNRFVHGVLWTEPQANGFTMSRIERDGSSYVLAVPYTEFNKIVDRFVRLIEELRPFMPGGVSANDGYDPNSSSD